MDGLVKILETKKEENEFSFKNLFVPLTTTKAIHIIAIVGFIVYFNMLFNGFVWDDNNYIILNQEIHTFDFSKIFGPSMFNSLGFYRPIPAFYFTLVYSIFGDFAFLYHLPQITLHIINGILIYLLFKKFFNKYISLFLSLVFLIHPIQVESVSYIAQTNSVLFLFFGLIALFLTERKGNFKTYILVAISLLLSILTKETGALFLLILPLYVLLKNRKVLVHAIFSSAIVLCIYFCLRLFIGKIYLFHSIVVPISSLPLDQRILNMPAIMFYYLKTFFFPGNLAINQNWVISHIDFTSFYLPLIVIITFFLCLILIGILIYKQQRQLFKVYVFFFIWFIAGLSLLVQIVPLDMTVADRWFYFAMVGLLGVIGSGLQLIKIKKIKYKRICICIGVIILLLLSMRTCVRNFDWQDQITLYTHDTQIEDSYVNESTLGALLFSQGKPTEALPHLKRSVELLPYDTNLNNLGIYYDRAGNTELAKYYFLKAYYAKSNLYPVHKHNQQIYVNLINLLIREKEYAKAMPIIMTAISDYPEYGEFWQDLAITKYLLHDQSGALSAAKKALDLSPTQATNYIYLQILNKNPLSLDVIRNTH